MTSDQNLTIDDDFHLRILHQDVHSRSSILVDDCLQLVSKVKELQSITTSIHADMRKLAESAEHQKLKAIGQRIKRQHLNSKDSIRIEDTMTNNRIDAKEKPIETSKTHTATSLERTPAMKTNGGQRRQPANDGRG